MSLENNDAESLTGTKAFSQGVGSQAFGSVAVGIRSALDATSKRELSILRRISSQLFKDMGSKTIMMNQAFLDEEEVIRITNKEYETIKRQDIAGEFDLIIDISTPEKDNEKAEKLNMMMQTNAAAMDPELSKIIYAKIAKLWKQPELEEQIKSFEPKPDPAEEEMKRIQLENAQLTNQKLKMEIAEIAKDIESEDSKIDERDSRTAQNLDSESKENLATARYKNAQAAKLEEETDLLAQDFLSIDDGSKRAQQLEDKDLAHLSAEIIGAEKSKGKIAENEVQEFAKEDEQNQQHERNIELENEKAFNQQELQREQSIQQQMMNTENQNIGV